MFYKILGFLISAFFAIIIFKISLPFLIISLPFLLVFKFFNILKFVCDRVKNI